jgi:hypothetical protein
LSSQHEAVALVLAPGSRDACDSVSGCDATEGLPDLGRSFYPPATDHPSVPPPETLCDAQHLQARERIERERERARPFLLLRSERTLLKVHSHTVAAPPYGTRPPVTGYSRDTPLLFTAPPKRTGPAA